MSKLFIFVDESGDIGDPSDIGSTEYYQLNILVISNTGIYFINKHISELRYFLNLEKELKDYWYHKSVRPKLLNSIKKIHSNIKEIRSYAFYLNKKLLNKSFFERSGAENRNGILKSSILYLKHNLAFENIDSVELVLDRYLDSKKQQDLLREGLQFSKIFPVHIHHISHIQSVYSDVLQYIDLVGRAVIDHGYLDLEVLHIDISQNRYM